MTVIATGFTEKKEIQVPPGKVVDLPRAARTATLAGATPWRRRAAEPRAETEDGVDMDDLDVPAFLRRQAD
jgi:hypothetical protein